METTIQSQPVDNKQSIRDSLDIIRKGRQALRHGYFSGRESEDVARFLAWIENFETLLKAQVKE
jgi:hypothetical protein